MSATQAIKRYHDRITNDPLLEEMQDCGALDKQYTEVIKAIREKRSKSWVQNSSFNPCRDFISVWDRLGTVDDNDSTLLILDIKRLVVPLQAIKSFTTAIKAYQKHMLQPEHVTTGQE